MSFRFSLNLTLIFPFWTHITYILVKKVVVDKQNNISIVKIKYIQISTFTSGTHIFDVLILYFNTF